MNLKHKSFPALSVKVLDKEQGILEAIVSVFTVLDCYDERIHPGFFAKSILAKYPKGVWMHDWTIPVAKTLEAVELLPGDARLPDELKELGGLYIKGQFNLDTQRGREAFSDIAFGIIDEFSIGFYPTNEKYDPKTGITELYEGTLIEWSPVLLGANPATTVISTKSALNKQARRLHKSGQIATEIAVLREKTTQDGEKAHKSPDFGVKFKGQFLGENVEAYAAYYAISDIYYTLHWCLYEEIFDDGPIEERLANMTGAFNEFRDVCLKIVSALVTDDATSEACCAQPEDDEELSELAARYKAMFLEKPSIKAASQAKAVHDTLNSGAPAAAPTDTPVASPDFHAAKSKAARRLALTQLHLRD